MSSSATARKRANWYSPLSIWRSLVLRPRAFAGAISGLAVLILLPESFHGPVREAMAWCAGGAVYLVETKAQGQLTSPNVLRKRKAAVAWCDRINGLPPEARGGAEWHYVLLGEATFYGWRDKGGSIAELLAYARLRPIEDRGQAKFVF